MQPTEKYRANADACMKLADTAPEQARLLLLEMAQAWRRLADSAEKIAELEGRAGPAKTGN